MGFIVACVSAAVRGGAGAAVPRARARKNCNSVDAERAGDVPAQVGDAMGLTTTLILLQGTATHLPCDRKLVGVCYLAQPTTRCVIKQRSLASASSRSKPQCRLTPSVIQGLGRGRSPGSGYSQDPDGR